jgi:hypothetical protein
VSSIYLDTPALEVISRSLDKPLYKEKLRLRVYGEGEPESVFFELKKKYTGIVYKRRVGLPVDVFLNEVTRAYAASTQDGLDRVNFCHFDVTRAVAEAGLNDYTSRQVARELNAALARHEVLVPSMLISCMRLSLGADAPKSADAAVNTQVKGTQIATDIRVTLDSDLHYIDFAERKGGFYLPQENNMAAYLQGLSMHEIVPADKSIVEIKTSLPYPKWLRNLLDATHTYPQSFSKYGTAAQKAYSTSAPPLKTSSQRSPAQAAKTNWLAGKHAKAAMA